MEIRIELLQFYTLLLKVKRTSLWNKACEELRKHQEFIAKVQQNPEFFKEPFGDPFSGEDLRAQLGGGEDSEDSDSEEDAMMNQDDAGLSSSAGKGKRRPSLPFYSDGEEDDTDDDFTERSKSQKLDLKKHKSHNSSSSIANGGSLSQKTPLAVATKTSPFSSTSPHQGSPMISPRNHDKKEEKLLSNKKLSKKKQKELYHQQQLLLEEATAKANESSNETLNGSSLKKKRGRPKKNKTEEPDGNSPSQNSFISSQVNSSMYTIKDYFGYSKGVI